MKTGSEHSAEPIGTSSGYRRSNSSPIALPETRLMLAIAARLPYSVTPNHMTALGLLGGLLSAAGYVLSSQNWHWLYLSVSGFVVHWLGDGLDGNLARFRSIERPVFGAFLDQTVDVLAIGATILGLGLSPYVRFDVALFMMIPYLLLVLLRHMRARATGIDEIAYGGIGGTEGRIIMIVITFAMMVTGSGTYALPFGAFSGFDFIFVAMSVWGLLSFTAESIRILRLLSLSEPPPVSAMLGAENTARREKAESLDAAVIPEVSAVLSDRHPA